MFSLPATWPRGGGLVSPLVGLLFTLALGACGSRRSPSPPVNRAPQVTPGAPGPGSIPSAATRPPATTGRACASDAKWITDLGKPPPHLSTLMRFDAMRKRGGFGPEGPVRTFNEFGAVTRSSEEKYEWKRPKSTRSDEQLVVLRGASGPIPSGYEAAPTFLPSGVREHPQRARKGVFGTSDPPYSLFVFPDGTWVRAEGDLATAVRAQLASKGTSPPLPGAHADVAWEVCGALDPNELSLPYDVWSIRGKRVAARLFASHPAGELVYDFDTPALASAAAKRQRAQCAGSRCPWMKTAQVEGDFVRYGVSIRKAPTNQRNDLWVAHTTPRLTAPPPAVPGQPPSGVYLQFVDILADTCPTQSAGKTFPRMHDLLLLTHKGGKAFTTLESVEPRAPGIMTASPVADVELRVGYVSRRETTHLCPSYTIAREMTVLEVASNIIKVRDIVRHVGSTVGCRHPNLPSNCHHEAITTWVLARKACDAHCDASYDGYWSSSSHGPAPGVEATCSCP